MLAAHRREFILDTVRGRGLVRLRDLIDELGVSMATVRRDVTVLAERGLVSRVHGAIRPVLAGNGDRADMIAQQAQFAQTDGLPTTDRAADITLGMLVPSASYYYPDVIRGARKAAAALGVRLVLGISHYNRAADRTRVEELLSSDVDGLLVTVSDQVDTPGADVGWLASLDTPVVMVERRADLGTGLERLDYVASDHVYGACLAVRHLAGLGHQTVTLVTRRDSPNRALVERGYRVGLREIGAKPATPITTPHPEYDPVQFDQAIRGVTEGVVARRISALLVHNDQDAIVLIQRLRAAGVRVPEDVALVAYDDEAAGLVDTPLTAIAPPKHAVGHAAVELIIARLAHIGTWHAHHVSLLPELRIRSSCGALGVA